MKDTLKNIFYPCILMILFFLTVITIAKTAVDMSEKIDSKYLETHIITIEEKYAGITEDHVRTSYYRVIDDNGNVYDIKNASLYIQIEKGKTYKIETIRKKSPKLITKIEDLNNEL